jgi:hypothetical protein
MADPNVSEIATVAIESRTGEIRDNVTKNNAILMRLKQKGKVRYFSGGTQINEEMTYQQNANGGFYSGFDLIPVAAQSVLTSAVFNIKQYAVAVVISGLEEIQNSGKEKIIDLLEARISNAEATMANDIAQGIYSDGTGSGGKTITGLQASVNATNNSGTYGGIDRNLWTFWRQVVQTGVTGSTDIGAKANLLWAQLVRGKNMPDLIMSDNTYWSYYMSSLQTLQRFTDPKVGDLGFSSVKFMTADWVLDGGIGGFAPATQAYFLNTDYLHWRPFKGRDMVPLSPNKRAPINQDAEVAMLGWAGNLTCSGLQFQGLLKA